MTATMTTTVIAMERAHVRDSFGAPFMRIKRLEAKTGASNGCSDMTSSINPKEGECDEK